MSAKRENFIRIAEKRVNRTINDLRLIGNLSNRGSYDYSEDDLRKIFSTLETELKQLRGKFDDNRRSEAETFRL